MRGLIWEIKQEWEWCLGKSHVTSTRVFSQLYCSLYCDNIIISGCTSEEGRVKGTCSRYVTGIGVETTGDGVILGETTHSGSERSKSGNNYL